MKFLTKMFVASALILPCFSVFADSPGGDPDNGPDDISLEVNQLLYGNGVLADLNKDVINKYYLVGEKDLYTVDSEGDRVDPVNALEDRGVVNGYQLRYGVTMLQTLLKTADPSPDPKSSVYVQDDLIFENEQGAKDFEKDLDYAYGEGQSFYTSLVVEATKILPIPVHRTAAVGYIVPGFTDNTVQVKHYFVTNPWGWIPKDHE